MKNKILAILTISILSLLNVFFYLYINTEFIYYQIFISISIILMITLLCYYFSRRKKNKKITKTEIENEHQINYIKKNVDSLFEYLIKHKIIDKHYPYNFPIYLFLGCHKSGKSTFLFENNFIVITDIETSDIKLWLHKKCAVVELSEELLKENYLEVIIERFLYFRPCRALDGIMLLNSCEELVNTNKNEKIEKGQLSCHQIKSINRISGLNLPVFLFLSHLDIFTNFNQLSSSANKQYRYLGWDFVKNKCNLSSRQSFNNYINQIIELLLDKQYQFLNIGSDNNASSILAFPYQFKEFLNHIFHYLQAICGLMNIGGRIELKGIVFYGNENIKGKNGNVNKKINELLSMSLIDNCSMSQDINNEKRHKNSFCYCHDIFGSLILTHPNLAGINQKKESKRLINYYFSWSVGAILFFLVTIQYNENWRNEKIWQNKTLHQLDLYNIEMNKLNSSVNETIADKLAPIFILHDIYQSSHNTPVWYKRVSFAQNLITQKIRKFYYQQVKVVIFPLLHNILALRLEQSLALEPEQMFLALQFYKMLFNPDELDKIKMKEYLANDIYPNENNELNELLINFIDDIDQPNMKDLYENYYQYHLVEATQKKLTYYSTDIIAYQLIRNSAEWSKNIPLSVELTQQLSQIFTFESALLKKTSSQNGLNNNVLSIPILFTQEGFQQIDLSATSPLLKQIIMEIEEVKDDKKGISLIEMKKISNSVKKQYTADYINFWRDFIFNFSIKTFKSKQELLYAITLLSRNMNNPVNELLLLIDENTNMQSSSESLNLDQSKQVASQLGLGKTARSLNKANRLNKTLGGKSKSESAEQQIQNAFKQYHKLIVQTEGEYINMASFYSQLQKINQEWKQGESLAQQNEHYYHLVIKNIEDKANNLPQETSNTDNYPYPFNDWLKDITEQNWSYLLNYSGKYLDSLWNKTVYTDYQAYFANKFPFNRDGKETSLMMLNKFFGVQGTLNSFLAQLKPFINEEEGNIKFTDLASENLNFSPQFLEQINYARYLQSLFFDSTDDVIKFKLSIRPWLLSPEISDLQLHDTNILYRYQQGPQLWKEIEWPSSQATEIVYLDFYKGNRKVSSDYYSGKWGLFKLIFAAKPLVHNEDGHRFIYQSNNYQFIFDYQVNGKDIVISEDLFSHFKPTESILLNEYKK